LMIGLLGLALTIHLWIQKERGFAQGCWGIAAGSPAAAGADCTNKRLEAAAELFGVPTVAWGYGFYVMIAGLALGKVLLPPQWARRCHSLSEMVVGAAFPYTGYLVYFQAFVAHAYCPLCLVSAGLVTALLVIHIVQHVRGGFEPVPDAMRAWEAGWAAVITFAGAGLLMGLLVFVDGIGGVRSQGARSPAAARVVPPLNLKDWLTADAPLVGTKSGPSVVAFFDPNCPHCAGTYATVMKVAEHHGDQAGVYVLPRALWDYSILQVQALELARRSGKYHEMWRLQFEKRQKGGMKFKQVEQLFQELGLDITGLDRRLEEVKPVVLAERKKAEAAGLNSTPAIYVNGVAVAGPNRTETGLVELIEEAVAAQARSPGDAPKATRP
jgi:protein-disulfide isomerase/uncharacterized membrane protein